MNSPTLSCFLLVGKKPGTTCTPAQNAPLLPTCRINIALLLHMYLAAQIVTYITKKLKT